MFTQINTTMMEVQNILLCTPLIKISFKESLLKYQLYLCTEIYFMENKDSWHFF